MATKEAAAQLAKRLDVSQAALKKAVKASIKATVLDPGKQQPAKVDENEVCPKCGQDKQHGYVSTQIPIFGVPVRFLYSSACGFSKIKPLG